MVNMRAGLPRLGTVCDEYGIGREEIVRAKDDVSAYSRA